LRLDKSSVPIDVLSSTTLIFLDFLKIMVVVESVLIWNSVNYYLVFDDFFEKRVLPSCSPFSLSCNGNQGLRDLVR